MIFWKDLLKQGLDDDGWEWDWTTMAAQRDPNARLQARLVAKSSTVWAAEGLCSAAEHVAREMGQTLVIRSQVSDGSVVKKGEVLAEWKGTARAVLALERPFINVAAYACGVAAQARELSAEVARAWKKLRIRDAALTAPRVTSTRKTLPGYRDLAVHAIRCGGGFPHRLNLAGGVLIKENHIAAAGGIAQATRGARMQAPHLLKIEVEVTNLDELKQALDAGADAVMLDNFSPAQVKSALKAIAASSVRPIVEVSGGITRETVARYVMPGVHVLSSGALSHSVRSADLSLLAILAEK